MEELQKEKDGNISLEEFISFFISRYKNEGRIVRRRSVKNLVRSGVMRQNSDLMDRIMFGIKNLEVDQSDGIMSNGGNQIE